MAFITSLLKTLASNVSNLFIYAIIIAVFIIGLLYCIVPVIMNRTKLRSAIRNIKAGDKAKRSWQENNFLGTGNLMAHWSAYLNNLFFADGSYHNPSNVEDFINEETVIYGPGRAAFADAVPSLLVSLGFLGTLIGLANGLSGFSMTDSAAAMTSIMTLVPGMKHAFTTSIYGVVGSVLFTLITRAIYGSTEHTLRSFYGAMSRYAGVLSVDPLTQLAIYQQEQTSLIQTMAKDLNGSFVDNMANAIEDAVEPINQNLKTFMTVTSKEQMRFLDAVVMRFVDRMDETLSGQFRELGRTLEATNRSQREAYEATREVQVLVRDMVAGMRDVQNITRELMTSMGAYVSDLRTAQKQAQEGYARLGSTAEQMNLVAGQQNSYLKTVSAMQAEISRSLETMTNSMNAFTRRFSEENAAAADALQKASVELRNTGAHLENVQKKTSKVLEEELKNTLDSYREYVNQFTQRVDYLAAGISDSLSTLPRAVGETSDQFLDQIDRLTHTLADAQSALDAAVDRLYGN